MTVYQLEKNSAIIEDCFERLRGDERILFGKVKPDIYNSVRLIKDYTKNGRTKNIRRLGRKIMRELIKSLKKLPTEIADDTLAAVKLKSFEELIVDIGKFLNPPIKKLISPTERKLFEERMELWKKECNYLWECTLLAETEPERLQALSNYNDLIRSKNDGTWIPKQESNSERSTTRKSS